jgi:5-enolpyruvylshikimate-3-phosphate synthase
MKRIMTPLNSMGAHITSLNDNDCAPLRIRENCTVSIISLRLHPHR